MLQQVLGMAGQLSALEIKSCRDKDISIHKHTGCLDQCKSVAQFFVRKSVAGGCEWRSLC